MAGTGTLCMHRHTFGTPAGARSGRLGRLVVREQRADVLVERLRPAARHRRRHERAHRRRAGDVHHERDLAEVVARAAAAAARRATPGSPRAARRARRRSGRRARPRGRRPRRPARTRAPSPPRASRAARRAGPTAARARQLVHRRRCGARAHSSSSPSSVVLADRLRIVVPGAAHRVLLGAALESQLVLLLRRLGLRRASQSPSSGGSIVPPVSVLDGWKHCPRCARAAHGRRRAGRMPAGPRLLRELRSRPPAPSASTTAGRVLLVRRAHPPFQGAGICPAASSRRASTRSTRCAASCSRRPALEVEPGDFLGVWTDTYSEDDSGPATLNLYWIGPRRRRRARGRPTTSPSCAGSSPPTCRPRRSSPSTSPSVLSAWREQHA